MQNRNNDQTNSGFTYNRWNRIQSLTSLLIFNTSELAFASRSLKTSDSRTKQALDVVDSRLSSAPASIGTPAEDINELHYGFGLSGAPQMDSLPMALPSLPGIADEFATDPFNDLPMITPNDNNQTLLPVNALPFLPSFEYSPERPTISVTDFNNSNSSPSALLVPPPPPPPPQIDSVDGQAKSKSYDLPSMPTLQSIPPPPQVSPPPPPPPSMPPPPPPTPDITVSSPQNQTRTLEHSMSLDTGRSSLLESIRMAGGKPKKKTAKEKKIDEKIKKKESQELGTPSSKASGGGDLMSDLMKRLALRRDGISGANKVSPSEPKNKKSRSNPSAMDRVSAMIPAPVEESVIESGNESSDPDWAD